MKLVSRRTGLSPHVIRVWEKRYGAICPQRTPTQRRQFSDEDIRRLLYLKRLTEVGHNIGSVASLPTEDLQELLGEERPAEESDRKSFPADVRFGEQEATAYQAPILEAIRGLNASQLEAVLNKGLLDMGLQGLLVKVIAPLLERVGELWQTGDLKPAEEHFASCSIKGFLERSTHPYISAEGLPNLTVATPVGQLHELGAVLAATLARNRGWRVTYLGPSLPAHEIAAAALKNSSRAVALSVVYPPGAPYLGEELRHLRELLSKDIAILVGGKAVETYQKILHSIGARIFRDLESLSDFLDELNAKGLSP